MTSAELRKRTAAFAVTVVRFAKPFLTRLEARDAALQLIRAARSVGANYRAACRARSHLEFTAKIGVVLEEADEALYWLEHLDDADLAPKLALSPLLAEAGELAAIFTAAARTARSRHSAKDGQGRRHAHGKSEMENG